MFVALAFALATLSPGAANPIPAFMQAGKLEALCDAGAVQGDAELCAGYILGSVDQVLAEQDIWGRRRSVLCLPEDISVDQLKSTIVPYFQQKPDQSSLAAATLIAAALKASYPCVQRRGGR